MKITNFLFNQVLVEKIFTFFPTCQSAASAAVTSVFI